MPEAIYRRDGFCLVPEAVPEAVLLAAQQGAAQVRDGHFDTGQPPSSHPGFDPAALCKINDAHLANRALYDLVTEPSLGELAARVVGAQGVQLWASQLLIKPPDSGGSGHVGWHQDRQYWRYWQQDEGLFTMWIALSDVGQMSGPVRFVVGSHRWGFLAEGDFFGADHAGQQRQIPVPEGQQWKEQPALLPAGGVSLHHCLTYHGSGANTSTDARVSLAIHLRTEAATPIPGDSNYYVSHLDEPQYSPVMYGSIE